MKNKLTLEFLDVKGMAAAAEKEALQNQWAVTIAIVDDGGHLLWLQRLDGAAPVSALWGPGCEPGWGDAEGVGACGRPRTGMHHLGHKTCMELVHEL